MLRRRRRGQDHGRSRPRPARGRARAQGRRAHHRPRPSAGPVARPHRARQHPAPGGGLRHRVGRVARRDDARHEAHLRRGRRGARDAGEGRADPGQPLLPGGVELVRGHAGVHGHGEARPAAQPGSQGQHLGPHRRRHPALEVGAGLPRRAQAPRLLPRRPLHPAAHGARQGRRPGLPEGVQHRRQHGDHGDVEDPRRPGAAGRADVRRGAGHHVRRASASAPTRPTPC